jgi:hypothetical protein
MAINPGVDASGNNNNWTVNNINYTTVGSTYDTMTDVPTLTSATTANFAVLNPIAPGDYFASGQTALTLSSANLNYGTGGRNAFGTIAVSSGKYYWEMSNTANTASAVTLFGLVTVAARTAVYGVYYNSSNGNKGLGTLNSGASETAYGASWTDNDIIGVALDMDAATPTVTFYKNNTTQGAISVSSFVGQSVMVWIQNGANSGNMSGWINHGQRPFNYTPPTGYVALNTFNLPTPTIGASASTQANKYFDVLLYTGNGSSNRAVSGLSFQPDFMWSKSRSNSYGNKLYDAVRGVTKQIVSNDSATESTTGTENLVSFDSGGVTIGNDTGINGSGATFVDWFWKANGTGVSNTAGSITSTVSANTSAGFSIVTFSTNASSGGATIGHGLGVAPSMILMKARNQTYSWDVYHVSLGANYRMILNSTAAISASSSDYWNSTTPTSSVFSINQGFYGSGVDTVAYCFSEVAGYSKFGSYTGNGSNDGVFLYCGFRPRFIMFKCTSALGHWIMFDSARNTYNVVNDSLRANVNDAENESYGEYDFTSNGLKIRTTDIGTNGSGSSYIFMAFAENPFKYSLAR